MEFTFIPILEGQKKKKKKIKVEKERELLIAFRNCLACLDIDIYVQVGYESYFWSKGRAFGLRLEARIAARQRDFCSPARTSWCLLKLPRR